MDHFVLYEYLICYASFQQYKLNRLAVWLSHHLWSAILLVNSPSVMEVRNLSPGVFHLVMEAIIGVQQTLLKVENWLQPVTGVIAQIYVQVCK